MTNRFGIDLEAWKNMTEEERKAYKAQREAEQLAQALKQQQEDRKAYKKQGQELATLQDMKREVYLKTAEFLKASDGKQFTKRIADALSKALDGLDVRKVSDWSEYLYIYLPNEDRRHSYDDVRIMVTMQLDTCKRIKGEQMADLLTHWAESAQKNADGYRATDKELEKAIKDADKIRQMIREFSSKYSYYTAQYKECDWKR